MRTPGFTRREFLAMGLAAGTATVLGAIVAAELVDHGVLPGKSILDRLAARATST